LDQDEAGRIEAKAAEPMAIRKAEEPAGQDKDHRGRFWQTAEQGRGKAERCRPIFRPSRADLMEGAEGETPLRQAVIERRNTEGKDAGGRQSLHLRQEAPQFMHHVSTLA
jgi:hypothetical protein